MENKINLIKNNDNRDISDVEWIEEFYYFMQGITPDGVSLGNKLNLKPKQAFSIIWYLQEHFPILPDHVERCEVCNTLFNTNNEGLYLETSYKGNHHFCDNCIQNVPEKIIIKNYQ